MTSLVLRLAGPVQSWGRYRVSYTQTPTAALPTRSGVAGLLGACLGVKNYLALLDDFALRVRVDATNPVAEDIQVASAPAPASRSAMGRSLTLTHAKVAKAPAQLTGTDQPSLAHREFIPHAEFICEVVTESAATWYAACRRPRYMPYLGRQSHAPTFPVLLGWSDLGPGDVLASMPVAAPGRRPAPQALDDQSVRTLEVHDVGGGYADAGAPGSTRASGVTVPVSTRKEQLAWITSHLHR